MGTYSNAGYLQDDDAAWGDNPFDCDTASATHTAAGEEHALADLDARIQEYESEHIWDGEGSMCSFRYAGHATMSCMEPADVSPTGCCSQALLIYKHLPCLLST